MGSQPNSALKVVFGAMTLGEKGLPHPTHQHALFTNRYSQALIKPAFIPWGNALRFSMYFSNLVTQRSTRPECTAEAAPRNISVNWIGKREVLSWILSYRRQVANTTTNLLVFDKACWTV